MRVIAAYLLAVVGGNKNAGKDDIGKILSSVGITADAERVDLLLKEMKDKNIDEVGEAGKAKLASFGGGKGGGAELNVQIDQADTAFVDSAARPILSHEAHGGMQGQCRRAHPSGGTQKRYDPAMTIGCLVRAVDLPRRALQRFENIRRRRRLRDEVVDTVADKAANGR